MFDELDDGARTGVWVALGVVAFVLFGLLGGLAIRQIKPAAAPVATAAAPAAAVDLDALLDLPLAGDLAGTLFFEVGQSGLTQADGPAVLAAIRGAADAAPARRLVISGFHDASGDPQMNHDLAKQRAIAVRDALVGAGVARERLQLRKPASTDGGSPDDPQARRVEVHLVD
ncbi:MAG: OmpA family protein [Burkholderiaceae bacterium]|nr:OmpA family protein [Burkholderiaceae bacterium]